MSALGNISSASSMLLSDFNGLIPVNLAEIIFILAVAVFTFVAAKLVDKLMDAELRAMNKKMNVDQTSYNLLRHISVAVVYLIGLIIVVSSIPFLEKVSLALLAGAGFAGIVVGLAAQSTLGNIIAGISLAVFRPFRVGDRVNVMHEYGKITDITLRHTVLRTWDNRRVIIPNSVIGDEAIINWSIEDPTVNWPVDIGISYDSDIDLARKIITEEARRHVNVLTHVELVKYDPTIQKNEAIQVLVTELGEHAVNMRLLFWCADRKLCYTTGCEIRESIKKRFDAEGVEIPFPYRTIVYKKDMGENARLKSETPTNPSFHASQDN
ncbi:small-conductance mechanosensitive channel [Methanomethylovorans hollandica DSM 15978]|uniref:Small-conductance mechanosensitive channel n=1 Tax=Methanomethylovorans hollandica (strain DSM 15978 / NBRC 107637 / DMS1) TaxID=867904 RepID=L0L0W9_METHD|nr:mechanosensitive ion channel family protein [Methanomethylovorans hollandica]AGB50038.1 small-conductance mechanosensitive channel [Methanomethylovorans hollandica DSM 15978]